MYFETRHSECHQYYFVFLMPDFDCLCESVCLWVLQCFSFNVSKCFHFSWFALEEVPPFCQDAVTLQARVFYSAYFFYYSYNLSQRQIFFALFFVSCAAKIKTRHQTSTLHPLGVFFSQVFKLTTVDWFCWNWQAAPCWDTCKILERKQCITDYWRNLIKLGCVFCISVVFWEFNTW